MGDLDSLEFNPASKSDAEALVKLRVDVMRDSLEAAGLFDPERARARFLNSFDPTLTTVILKDGLLVGFYVVRPREDHLLLDHLYIARSWQGSGVGSAVMKRVKLLAIKAALPIQLCALKDSPANHFYQHHGFKLTHGDALDNFYRFSI